MKAKTVARRDRLKSVVNFVVSSVVAEPAGSFFVFYLHPPLLFLLLIFIFALKPKVTLSAFPPIFYETWLLSVLLRADNMSVQSAAQNSPDDSLLRYETWCTVLSR
jgi:hypothetical protein